jgi:nitroimidazol reductase NimA-like FMN-containing flavoprotein (pyridoxamine 5'-phosphate oxidase superfamily)
VASARVLPSSLTTLYESAVVFGRATRVTDPIEKEQALRMLANRFYGSSEQSEQELRTSGPRAAVVRIEIERITGKAHRPPQEAS